MNPLSDRSVVVALIATVALVFALVFWTVRLAPSPAPPLRWRDGAPEARPLPTPALPAPAPPAPGLPGAARGGQIL